MNNEWWFTVCPNLEHTHDWPIWSILHRSTIVPPPQSPARLPSNCSCCNWAWAQLLPAHTPSYCSTVVRQEYSTDNNNFLGLIFSVVLVINGHILDFLIVQGSDYASCLRCVRVLVFMCVQPYCVKAHLTMAWSRRCTMLEMVLSAHTSPTNWTLWVKHAWACYGLPSTSAPLLMILLSTWIGSIFCCTWE